MCVFWVGAPFSSYQYWCLIVSKKFLQAIFFEAIHKFIVKSILITLSNNHASHLLLPTNLPSYFPLKHALYLIPQTTLAHISNQANFSPKKLLRPTLRDDHQHIAPAFHSPLPHLNHALGQAKSKKKKHNSKSQADNPDGTKKPARANRPRRSRLSSQQAGWCECFGVCPPEVEWWDGACVCLPAGCLHVCMCEVDSGTSRRHEALARARVRSRARSFMCLRERE